MSPLTMCATPNKGDQPTTAEGTIESCLCAQVLIQLAVRRGTQAPEWYLSKVVYVRNYVSWMPRWDPERYSTETKPHFVAEVRTSVNEASRMGPKRIEAR